MEKKQRKYFHTQVKDIDGKGRVLVAANAIGNVDSDKDISLEGSFNKTLSEHFDRVKWYLNHNQDFLLGVPLEGKQNGKYLEMLGQLNLIKQIGSDVYSDYKLYAEHGKTLEHSIGVNAIKWDIKNDVRNVSEWKLWEYSTLYGWGANPDTPMLGIKSTENLSDSLDWLDIMLRKGNYTDERCKQIEAKIAELKSLMAAEPVIATPNLIEPNGFVIDAIREFKLSL